MWSSGFYKENCIAGFRIGSFGVEVNDFSLCGLRSG